MTESCSHFYCMCGIRVPKKVHETERVLKLLQKSGSSVCWLNIFHVCTTNCRKMLAIYYASCVIREINLLSKWISSFMPPLIESVQTCHGKENFRYTTFMEVNNSTAILTKIRWLRKFSFLWMRQSQVVCACLPANRSGRENLRFRVGEMKTFDIARIYSSKASCEISFAFIFCE